MLQRAFLIEEYERTQGANFSVLPPSVEQNTYHRPGRTVCNPVRRVAMFSTSPNVLVYQMILALSPRSISFSQSITSPPAACSINIAHLPIDFVGVPHVGHGLSKFSANSSGGWRSRQVTRRRLPTVESNAVCAPFAAPFSYNDHVRPNAHCRSRSSSIKNIDYSRKTLSRLYVLSHHRNRSPRRRRNSCVKQVPSTPTWITHGQETYGWNGCLIFNW